MAATAPLASTQISSRKVCSEMKSSPPQEAVRTSDSQADCLSCHECVVIWQAMALSWHKESTVWCEVDSESSISMSCADTIYVSVRVKE